MKKSMDQLASDNLSDSSTVISQGIGWKRRVKGVIKIKPVFWLLTHEQLLDENLQDVCSPRFQEFVK